MAAGDLCGPSSRFSNNVLLVTPHFPPDRISSVESYVHTLARRLQDRLPGQVVIATTTVNGSSCRGEVDGLVVYRLSTVSKISNAYLGIGWPGALRRIIFTENIGLVNVHAPAPLFADIAARASGRLPLVLTCHAGLMRRRESWSDILFSFYRGTVLPEMAARADRIICSSDSLRSTFASIFGVRATTITPGIEVGVFRPGGQAQPDRLLFVGSLDGATDGKVFEDLLECVRLLRTSRPKLRLVVAGDGDGRAGLQRKTHEMGLDGAVSFVGAIGRAEAIAQYQSATAVVVPTHFDSFPTVIAEAMACGRPVVSTKAPDVLSLVNSEVNGLLAAPGDIASLVSSVERLLGDEALARRLGVAARDCIVSGLSWEAQSQRTAEVFNEARDLRQSRRRRTVAIVTPYYAPKIGGVERYAQRVANAVHNAPDLDAIVVSSNHEGWRTEVELVDDVPVIRLGTWFKLSNTPISPLWLFQLVRIFKRERVGLVNAHSPVPYLAELAVAAAAALDTPVAMTYHTGRLAKGIRWLDPLLRFYEQTVLAQAFRHTDVNIAVSPVSMAYGRGNSIVISPGVDTSFFTPGPPAVATDGQEILYVGRLDHSSAWKGVDVLLDAFAQIVPRLPRARLVLVGNGDAVADHRSRAARLGIADCVAFRGFLNDVGLVEAYRRATVVVLPSLTESESFGMALLEGMSCGRPVVGSRVGGIPIVVTDGDDGLLVPPATRTPLQRPSPRSLSTPNWRRV